MSKSTNKKSEYPKVKYRLVNRMGSQTFHTWEQVLDKIAYYRTEEWSKNDPAVQPQYAVKITEEYIDLEQTNEKKYVLAGVVLPFNTKSQTGRVYTRESISKEVFNNFVERVKMGNVAGVLEQRHSLVGGDAPLQEISHKVVDAKITDAGVQAVIEVLDTPKGNLVKTVLDNGMALWGASRAMGAVGPDGQIQLDQVISFDLTGCPSFDPNQVEPLRVTIVKRSNS